jgi:hypothetical protein
MYAISCILFCSPLTAFVVLLCHCELFWRSGYLGQLISPVDMDFVLFFFASAPDLYFWGFRVYISSRGRSSMAGVQRLLA